jgi:peptidoglycan/LPS O-acetylase OafA/YrhL
VSKWQSEEAREPLLESETMRKTDMSHAALSVVAEHKMPQLDSLRAFAVMAVLSVHFVSHPPQWLNAVPWAALGVELFFVLSGFLITGILLDCREQGATGTSRFWMLRQFYARRFLRIFPVYYAVVLIGYLINLSGFTETLGWNLAYLTNFYIAAKGAWIGAASHLWTLSVEEQFYLAWPWIVLFVREKYLLSTFVGVILFAIGYRIISFDWFGEWINITPFASFDCFGAGALLALAQRRERRGDDRLRRVICLIGLWLGVPLLILALAWHVPRQSILGRLVMINLATTLLFIPLISGAANSFSGLPGWLLMQRPIRYLGRISYGIYIFHLPVGWLVGNSHWINRLPHIIPRSLMLFLVTVLVSALSWHFFESPINRLKRLFPYRTSQSRAVREGFFIEAARKHIP